MDEIEVNYYIDNQRIHQFKLRMRWLSQSFCMLGETAGKTKHSIEYFMKKVKQLKKIDKILERYSKNIRVREPQRIDRILELISIIWHYDPDLRLGQLLYNCADFIGDIHSIEDDITERKLLEFIGKHVIKDA